MRPIVFVSDLMVHPQREVYRSALRAIADPVFAELPEATWSERPVEGALNVRFFTRTLDGQSGVFIGHGLADKNYSHYHNVTGFEAIFCSGTTWHARYIEQGAPEDKLRITGFPKLDPLFNGTITRGNGKRTLWAPTHPTSWPAVYRRLRGVIESLPLDIALAPHPQVSTQPTLQALADADVVIADAGSMVYEAWALGKPVVFPSWLVWGRRHLCRLVRPGTLEQDIYRRGIGYHAESSEHLIEQIHAARENGITEAEREFAEGILPTPLRGKSGRAYAEALRDIA